MTTPRYVEHRNRVMVGNLPEDFLRVESPSHEVDSSHRPSQQVHAGGAQNFPQANSTKQITICVVQAQLAKNYSLTKMDPYARIRIGHSVFETHTDISGGKLPNWNKTFSAYLPNGIKTIHLDVYDERTLTSDERIAYADFEIPDEGMRGDFIDTWVPLNGKQGEGKEGSINITVCIRSVPYWPSVMPTPSPLMVVPQGTVGMMPYYMPAGRRSYPYNSSVRPGICLTGQPVPIQYQPGPNPLQNQYAAYPQTQPYRPTESDIKQLQEMFPDFDQEIIQSVLQTCQGNKEQATSTLLSLSDK